MPDQLIIPTAEPFLFPGSKTGCLLIHGFTGTPKEMRWMGEYLSQLGHTVLGIRLAGHATQPADLMRTRWWDWLASVEDGIHFLKNNVEHIFVVGLSMGGVLALLSAGRYPITGAVAMSTPYALPPDWRLPYLRWISWLEPEIDKGPPDWRDLDASKEHVTYPRYPTRGLAELNDLLAEMRAVLPGINVPVLLMHSRQDTGVKPHNMEKIFERLGSMDKDMFWLENSGHVITREPERLTVFKKAAGFIDRIIHS
jgi:carboxylesterase